MVGAARPPAAANIGIAAADDNIPGVLLPEDIPNIAGAYLSESTDTDDVYRVYLSPNETFVVSLYTFAPDFELWFFGPGATNVATDIALLSTNTGSYPRNLVYHIPSDGTPGSYYLDVYARPVSGTDSGAYDLRYLTLSPVYRFYNFINGVHFYTRDYAEAQNVGATAGWTFRSEGSSFSGYRNNANNMYKPVHRFYNFIQGAHFYTANQAEATYVNDNLWGTFRYEGVAYYASNPQLSGEIPVHRFYNFLQGVHFYTADQAEATYVNDNLWGTFRYEGIAYYVLP
jgi:hypothetical protein